MKETSEESKTMQFSILTVKGSSFPRGGEGGDSLEIFGWQCAAGTLDHLAYTSGLAEFFYPIKLNFPNPSVSKNCSLISIPKPILN